MLLATLVAAPLEPERDQAELRDIRGEDPNTNGQGQGLHGRHDQGEFTERSGAAVPEHQHRDRVAFR